MNMTAWDEDRLVGCARLLTDGYFLTTITEILVLPDYRKKGIGRELMRLAYEASPCTLSFGAQQSAEGFYLKLGYEKTMNLYQKAKKRRK